MPSFALLRRLLPLTLIGLLVACTPPAPSPTPTPVPSPTVSAKNTPAPGSLEATKAAALVLSADPRFVGFAPLNPALPQERWYEMTADGNTWDVTLTVGWGDCSAGCAHHHSWHYRVGPDAKPTLVEESGEGLPADAFPSPASGVARVHLVTTSPCADGASCAFNGVPGAGFKFARFGAAGGDLVVALNADSKGSVVSSLPGGVYIVTTTSRPDGGPLPAPFALSLAPGRDNVVSIAFAAAPPPTAAPASPDVSPSSAP